MRFSTLLLLAGILVGCCIPAILAKKNVVCYMAAWSIFRPGEGKFKVLDAETDHCTHVVYAFMGLDEYTNEMISIDRSIDGPGGNDQLSKLKQLKERNPDLKIQVSIGGYNEKGKKFSYLAADPERREQFIESVVRFLEKYELDGLDICWQFPGLRGGRPIDKQNAVTLFQEIKTAFIPKGYLLTLHILGKPYIIDEYNIKAVADIVDFINLVCVEYSGPWERTTGVMAPLDSKNKNNVRFAVNYIKLKGAPPNKVNLGLPLYGHAYVLDEVPKEDKLLGLFSNKTFQGPWTAEWGITAFSETCHKFRYVEGWKQVWDEESKTPLAYNGKMFMSFDNEKSLRLKADLVEEKALAGVAFWSLDMDDFRGLCFGKKYPMVSAISEYINRKSSLQATPFTPTHEPPMQTTIATGPPAGEDISYTERNETVEVDYISVTTEDSEENEIQPLHRNRTIRSHADSPKVVVCYIAEWSASRSGLGKFSISDADTEHCTHIIYAFVTIDESTNKIKTIGIQANSDIPKLKELKAKNPTIKVSVSIGGWGQGSTRFSEMASTPEKRRAFIKSVVEFIKIHELNGIDMCWQFPTQRGGKPEDKLNSLKLFKELKSAFQPKGWILTVHVLGQKYIVDSYDIKAVSETVDYINFAAVEYHGPWEKTVNPTTPLTSSDESNVKFNVDYILQQGVSPNKILLGLPTYGHAYSLAEDVRGKLVGIYYDHAVTSLWTKEPGLIAYNEICYEMTNNGGWNTEFEEHSQTPFSYFQQQLATYENEKSLRLKAKLVREKNLAGVMIWSLDMDDFRGLCHEGRKYPLVTSVTEYINRPNFIKIKTTEAPIPPTPPPFKKDETNGTQIVSFTYGEH